MLSVLIISPYFPPVNAADMQRVRMSIPYFKHLGWDAEVVCVDAIHADMVKDNLLCNTVPADIPIHKVKAFAKKHTAKLGLGSIALRSFWFYRKKVNTLLRQKKFDLIYFSTTQFPVCVLGSYWKRKFGVPYVIDVQDPWHSDYYQNKPKSQRPPKYWFSYRLNKWLEPMAMKQVDGLISVSETYINVLKNRYQQISKIPSATIPFAAFEPDLLIAEKHRTDFPLLLNHHYTNIVYVGRGGHDMHKSVKPVFNALKQGLVQDYKLFKNLRICFIGTSYAPSALAKQNIKPLAEAIGLGDAVFEQPGRIGFYHALSVLQQADALFIPGSDDASYTASKIYPYMLVDKPLLAIFHPQSSATGILTDCTDATVLKIGEQPDILIDKAYTFLEEIAMGIKKPIRLDHQKFEKYMAPEMVVQQVNLFNSVVK